MTVSQELEKIFSLEGKTVLLTGATGGIGSELAKGLSKAGAKMALADISMDLVKDLMGQIESDDTLGFVLDISDIGAIKNCVEEVIKKCGKIDILINCAGINKREGLLDVKEATFDRIMDINLKGVFFLTQEVVLQSMKNTGGKIINIGSVNCTSMLGGVSVYGATKSAVAALTRSMAIEWAKFNIQANCIAPGHILTPLTEVTWRNEHRANYLTERIAAERPGNPDELIGITILLASNASSYMTGQLYNVDGGVLAGGKPWQYDTEY